MTNVKSTGMADRAVTLRAGDERLALTFGSLKVLLDFATEMAGIPRIRIVPGDTTVSGEDSARVGAALVNLIATLGDNFSPFLADLVAANPDDALVALAIFARNASKGGFVIEHERTSSQLSRLPIDRTIIISIEDN